ncbi:MAG: hypothetical protein GY702_18240, partial [Desulfobulbaceae bacterium]|nr:hypothetical protein [Desulfobulbaceae bacterium]
MTKTKKTILIVSVSLFVIVASGFSFAMITGACGHGPGFGHGFHKRGMPPFMHKEIGSFMLWKLDKEAKNLDLSKAQQKEYNAFRNKLEKTMNDGIETKMEFKKQTVLEFDKENPDLSSISTRMQSNIELMSASLSENLALFTDFYNSLNNKQKGIITEKIKERIES